MDINWPRVVGNSVAGEADELVSAGGAGDSRTPMFIMLGSFVLFRQIYLYIMSNYISNTIRMIALGYPAGWLLCSTITLIYFFCSKWEKHKLVEDGKTAEGEASVSEAEAKA